MLGGYKQAKLSIQCDIREIKGEPHIRVLNAISNEKSEQKEAIIFDSEKIKIDKTKSADYKNDSTVPIDQIKDTLYVAYNATGINPTVKESWMSDGMTLKLTFIK